MAQRHQSNKSPFAKLQQSDIFSHQTGPCHYLTLLTREESILACLMFKV